MEKNAHRIAPVVERLGYRPAEAAQALGVSRRKLYDLLNDGTLRSVKTGSARIIPRDSLLALLAGQPQPQN
jgi:excisionase family DNA binding protein